MEKTALVIGGSSGIGYATIRLLLKEGYKVFNGSRRPCIIDEVTNFTLDVANPETVKASVDEIVAQSGRIDLLVYSAGFSMAAPLEAVDMNDVRYLFDVNFFGFMETVKLMVPIMKHQLGGRIIVISSLGGILPIPYDSYYSASKAALNMLVLGLRNELEKFNILMTCLMPGGTRNDFTFKRKVYPLSPDYHDMERAVSKLAEIEQNGELSGCVAKTVIRVVTQKNPPIIMATGLKNKVFHFMSRFLPYKLQSLIVRRIFRLTK
jgi:short-subunit dehydrogenase